MTQDLQQRSWLSVLRSTFAALVRRRHYAAVKNNGAKPKLRPIDKILAEAGRDPAASVD